MATEMHIGLEDTFEYLECINCGCLQLLNIPTDFSKYYPQNYYSYNIKYEEMPIWKKFLLQKRASYEFAKSDFIGNVVSMVKPGLRDSFRKIKLMPSAKILDIGCGNGYLLKQLSDAGFSNLTGIDKYIDNEITYKNKIKIYKKEIFDINSESFDFIMLHHSFEHMSQPSKVLRKIYEILNPNSYALIRIPIASSFAWKHYNVNWVQLDAPRHLFLHTVKSMGILAQRANFKIKEIIYDSTDFQFYGSEAYLKDISLVKLSANINFYFSKQQRKEFQKKAKELNKTCFGDQACFYLQKN